MYGISGPYHDTKPIAHVRPKVLLSAGHYDPHFMTE